MQDNHAKNNFIYLFSVACLSLFSFFSLMILDFKTPSYQARAKQIKKSSENNKIILSFESQADDKSKIFANISTLTKKTQGLDLVISYNPNMLQVQDVLKGSFFDNPVILEKVIDNKNGKVKFSQGSFIAKKGKGNIAVLKINPQPGVKSAHIEFSKETKIAFENPKKREKPVLENLDIKF